MRVLVLVLLSVVLVGCAASYGGPAARQKVNQAASNYELCENLVFRQNESDAIRYEWAEELSKRGEDCQRYIPGMLAQVEAHNRRVELERREKSQRRESRAPSRTDSNALLMLGLQLLQQSGSQPPRSAYSPTPQRVTCVYQRDWASGMNRNCVYSCGGSEAVQTYPVATLCPLTIERSL